MNVVLFTLTLTNSLVLNGVENAKREMASKHFMKCLTAMIRSEKTNEVVNSRILELIEQCADAFKSNIELRYFFGLFLNW